MVDTVREDINTTATLSGGSVSGVIDQNELDGSTADADYYRVTLAAGHHYTFSANANVSNSDTLDSVFIRLRDAAGAVLSPEKTGEGATPSFSYDVPGSSGSLTYYLAISGGGTGSANKTGSYTVSLVDSNTVANNGNVTVIFSDPTGRYTSQKDLFVNDASAAWQQWATYLNPTAGTMDINLHLVTNYPNRGGGSSVTTVCAGHFNGFDIYDQGAAYELRTGIDPNGSNPDIDIFFDVDFLTQYYWLNPLDGTPPPANRNDLVDVIAHEIGHAIGFNGWRNSDTYQLPSNYESTFDALIATSGGNPYFNGSQATSLYGGPVPLTARNIFHFGNQSPLPGADLVDDLMNGVVFQFKPYQIGPLDVAVMSDLNIPTIFDDIVIDGNEADITHGGRGNDQVSGGGGNDQLYGDEGNDTIYGDEGNDTIYGGTGTDTAVFGGPLSGYTVARGSNGSVEITAANNGSDGTDTIFEVELFKFTDRAVPYTLDDLLAGATSAAFQPAQLVLTNFGTGAGGWSGEDQFPRELADVNHDQFPREMADVNHDGLADIVGFGYAGVWVALATGGGKFTSASLALSKFGASNSVGGWASQDQFPREMADVNHDGLADIVGFGYAGVWVALATGGSNFAQPFFSLNTFGTSAGAGGWSSQNQYPRAAADVNGDGLADIIGFGNSGVWEALGTGGGHFAAPSLVLNTFGVSSGAGGWSSQDQYPRELGDVNGDGLADIVAFGNDGIWVAHGKSDGSFDEPTFDFNNLGFAGSAGGRTRETIYPQFTADVTGDHKSDIVGFGVSGVWVSASSDTTVLGTLPTFHEI